MSGERAVSRIVIEGSAQPRPADDAGGLTSAEQTTLTESPSDTGSSGGSTVREQTTPARPRLDRMPPWNVLLHNDDVNEPGFVVETILELTALNPHDALVKMVEAHKTGVALLLTVHREFAELLEDQFASKGLTVTIEPDR